MRAVQLTLDFIKTFEKEPRGRLLHKVKSHGIQGKVADRIPIWLDDRRELVLVVFFNLVACN